MRALNGPNFFTAAVQDGFGPFIAVWLTQQGWTLEAIGVALSIGTFASLAGQLPGGMLANPVHCKRGITLAALPELGGSALLPCTVPSLGLVLAAAAGAAVALLAVAMPGTRRPGHASGRRQSAT
jgi:MFS family permease